MKTLGRWRVAGLVVGLIVVANSARAQGKLVVSHDEWMTGNGFFLSYDDQKFIDNSLNWFGVAPTQKVLIYTDNGFLTGADLSNYLQFGRGLAYTHNASETNLSQYAAIFVGGNGGMNSAALAAYVFAGGNVFIEGGTGSGGSGGEAGYDNPFLNALGLGFYGGSYNGLGPVNTSSFAGQGPFGGALFTGVNSVYANNGSDVLYSLPVGGVTDQIWYSGNDGVFGAAEVTNFNVTPEPASLLLIGTGLLGLVAAAGALKRSVV